MPPRPRSSDFGSYCSLAEDRGGSESESRHGRHEPARPSNRGSLPPRDEGVNGGVESSHAGGCGSTFGDRESPRSVEDPGVPSGARASSCASTMRRPGPTRAARRSERRPSEGTTITSVPPSSVPDRAPRAIAPVCRVWRLRPTAVRGKVGARADRARFAGAKWGSPAASTTTAARRGGAFTSCRA